MKRLLEMVIKIEQNSKFKYGSKLEINDFNWLFVNILNWMPKIEWL